MSNALSRFLDLLPRTPEFIATVQSADHPNYKVLVVDGTGLVLCTSSTAYTVGARVFISGQNIVRSSPTGTVTQIEV